MKIHHTAYLVKKMGPSLEAFEGLGFSVEREPKFDHVRNVNISFLVKEGQRIELVEPASEESPLYPLLKRYKNSPYHMCFETEDLDAALKDLEAKGFRMFIDRQTAPCLDGRDVIFLMHPDIGMVEILESKGDI